MKGAEEAKAKLKWTIEECWPEGEKSHPVQVALEELFEIYNRERIDSRSKPFSFSFNGDFETLTSPSFPGMLGRNERGEPRYTMGRMTFGMIAPTKLVCSIQRITQHVQTFDMKKKSTVPEKVSLALKGDFSGLRSLRTEVHFTAEESGLMGKLQVNGFAHPNLAEPNKYNIWFTGGSCYALKGQDRELWRRVFGSELPRRSILELLSLFLAWLFIGALPSFGLLEDDTLRYTHKPFAGTQKVVYLDDELKITRGNGGTIVIQSKMDSWSIT